MNQVLKVGVVGCGEIAQISHIPYLLESPAYEVAAICDLSPFVVEQLGKKYHLSKRYTSFEEMIKTVDLDVVLVTNKNHAKPAIAAMERGMHVLVEKPIAFNLNQADEMIHVAKSNQIKLMVGYMKRYDPAYQLMQKKVKELEKIHLIRVHDFAGSYTINQDIYDLVKAVDLNPEMINMLKKQDQADLLADIGAERKDLLDAHDIMIHLCIHDINALQGLFGLPEKVLSAQLFDKNFIAAHMVYNNGENLFWETGNLISLLDWDENITVYGNNQTLTLKFPFPYLKNAATELNIRENEGSSVSRKQIIASYDEAFRREWQHFYDCIIYDQEPETDAAQAKRDLEFAVELTKIAAGV